MHVQYTHSDPGTEQDFGEGTGPIHNLTCQQTDCEQVILTLTTSCSHSQDVGVRCQPYSVACEAEINERISSLTTAIPRECPIQPPTSSTEANAVTTCSNHYA